jgi:NADH-quinone oxidoreductase subunit L
MVGGGESQLLRWIVLLPLLAAAVHGVLLGLVRRPLQRSLVIAVSCGSVGLAFVVTFGAFLQLLGRPEGARVLVDPWFPWIGAGKFSADVAFLLDPLSAVMCLVVTGVGFLIHVYSIGYMDDDHREDKGFQRFFCYLNLFTFAMLVLVLGDNLLLMFLGWEGVGLCSYLLIGFWYGDRFNAYCGMKAFVVNRIGDFGFLIGIFLVFWTFSDAGTSSVAFRDLREAIGAVADQTVHLPEALAFLPGFPEWRLTTLIGLCLFVGAVGKSAQIPLYVWLPDAMAGPTPVSALIHAATMVTAGVYMVCRMGFLYDVAPGAAATVAWTGAVTALFAATIAIAQTDIKKVLAYSTVSQLGYMFVAAGCGGYAAAIFHLGTHAFFKALLFLGAGAVILAMHHEQDTDRMGGLKRRIPRTWGVFLIGVVAISGIPPFSGFFSKDEILLSAWTAESVPGHLWLWGIGVATAALTAFYMYRLHFRTFAGECRAPAEVRDRIHEPARVVLRPLYVLAFFAAVAGFFGLPQVYADLLGFEVENSNSLANFLAPVVGHEVHPEGYHPPELGLAAITILAAALGAGLAWLLYVRMPELPGRLRAAVPAAYRLVAGRYYVDEIYDALIVRPTVRFSDFVLFRSIDAGAIDGALVNGAARAVRAIAADVLRHLQSGFAQGYLFLVVVGTVAIVGWLLR